jgi:AbrB family looped-hinge helix DNA binding protein
MSIEVKLAANGRIVIPSDVRKQLGLEDGARLFLDVDEFGIHLTRGAERARKAQTLFRRLSGDAAKDNVERFLEAKRADAAAERF